MFTHEEPSITDEDVVRIMRQPDNPVAKAWRVFRTETVFMRKAARRTGTNELTAIGLARLELDAVTKILKAAGVDCPEK